MAAIGTGQDVVTLVNVFTVSPDRQRQLAGLLAEATRTTMNRIVANLEAAGLIARGPHPELGRVL